MPPAALTEIDQPIALTIDWRIDTRAAKNSAAYRLHPLLIGSRVYSIDTDGVVSSVDLESGVKLWQFETQLKAIAGLGGNQQLIIATSRDGEIKAYRTGELGLELVWKKLLESEIRSAAVVDQGQVFVRSVDGKLHSLDASSGDSRWVASHRVPALSLTGTSQPLVEGDRVIAGFDDGKLIAFDRDQGKILWETTIMYPSGRTEVERLVDLDGQFVLRDGVIYVSSYQGRLAAIQAVNGNLLWARDFSSYQAIAIDESTLFLSDDSSHIWAVDRLTGRSFWKQDVLGARRISAPTLLGNKLVVADLEGYVHWFDKTDGKLIGRIQPTKSRNYVQPLVWRNSILSIDKLGLLSSVSAANL